MVHYSINYPEINFADLEVVGKISNNTFVFKIEGIINLQSKTFNLKKVEMPENGQFQKVDENYYIVKNAVSYSAIEKSIFGKDVPFLKNGKIFVETVKWDTNGLDELVCVEGVLKRKVIEAGYNMNVV